MTVKLIQKLGSTMENHSKITSTGIAIVALVVMTIAIIVVDEKQTERNHAQERALFTEKLEKHSTLLEFQLNRALSHTHALHSLVLSRLKLKKLITEEYFLAFAEALTIDQSVILALQLSPDAMVTFVWPQSDRYLIGTNLQDHTKFNETVNRAIISKNMLVDGPRMLSQGVFGLVARLPIYHDEDVFWGFATVVIDFEQLLKASELQEIIDGLQIAIKGTNSKGSGDELFFGDTNVFNLNPVLADVVFQNGNWQLAGIRENGWSAHWPGRNVFILISIIISLILTYLIWQHSQRRFQIKHSEKRKRKLASKDGLNQSS